MKLFIFVAIFLLSVGLSTAINATEHRQPGRTKYLFIHSIVKENWFDALSFCHQRHFELVSIKSDEEQRQLNKFLVENRWDRENIWTAGNDLGKEGTLFWMTTGEDFGDYKNWATDPPTNSKTINCVHLNSDSTMKWNIGNCKTKMHFVCEQYYNN